MVRWIKVAACLSASLLLLTSCAMESTVSASSGSQEEPPKLVQLQQPQEGQEMAVIHTALGEIHILLYEEQAPQTVRQFKQLVQEGFYNGNRVFAIDPQTHSIFAGATDESGSSGEIATEDGKAVEPEVTPEVWHFSGAVSTYGTRTGIFNRRFVSDSRFFIVGDVSAQPELLEQMEENDYSEQVMEAYKKLGGCPQYTGFFTVFGQVIEGLDLVEQIAAGGADETGRPLEETVIDSIELTEYTSESGGRQAESAA